MSQSQNQNFFARLGERIDETGSVVCVGLDPDQSRLPDEVRDADLPRWQFNRRIIDATHEHAACYKPNAAFYEDADGWRALAETIAYAHGKDVPVIVDAKRADIGNTARQYAESLQDLDADAVTVNPYMGEDSLKPFLSTGLGVFILCRTSNPGGADIQNRELEAGGTVYEHVARLASTWNENDNVGLVVGATAPDELEDIRRQVPSLPFLVPGVGAQGGDAEAAVEYGLNEDGVGVVNSTRGIIFAGEDSDDWAGAAGQAAKRLKERLDQFR
ncbi:orotidine-5'-phosphate decarboxylase [Halospeciosus flavus]|uniref:Orotidine 5'-phosphate decarboxylase n=1 Tax=Halospeciosus flavus TaxID=3032283 RepID=A0ABD5Z1E3_9EURY|nr:orotidine-5'-phosphate decarboxylase [Halospeciosus flavus]